MDVIDLFAGAGGFGLGFTMSGYNVKFSLEFDKWACDTLRQNNNHTIIEADITKYKTEKTISKLITNSTKIIIGGPPCQGFSIAGKRLVSDPRNHLYNNFLKWVKVLKPNIFVIENVKGILTRKVKSNVTILQDIQAKSKKIGYHISVWNLNASNYGVPQNRNRIFIIGSRKCNHIPEPPKTHLKDSKLKKPISVGDAILDLPIILAKEGEEEMNYTNKSYNSYQRWSKSNSRKVYNHVSMKHTDRMVERYENIIRGNKMSDLSNDLKVRMRNGNGKISKSDYHSNYRLLKIDSPSFTIPAHFYSSFIHPTIPRNITTREAARLQSFPDRYVFKGKRTMLSKKLLLKRGEESYLSQYNQVGNAVPPLLAQKIATHLKKYI